MVSEDDCGGFGAYMADQLYQPVKFAREGIEEAGKSIQFVGS